MLCQDSSLETRGNYKAHQEAGLGCTWQVSA